MIISGDGPTEAPQCALPNPTSLAAPEDMGEGTFFGKSPHSYMQYTNMPHGIRVKYVLIVEICLCWQRMGESVVIVS